MKRFKDKNYLLSKFAHEIIVVCPSCQKKAKITKGDCKFTLYCSHCDLFEQQDSKLYSYKINIRCPKCDNKIYKSEYLLNTKETYISVTCKCGYSQMVKPKYTEDSICGVPRTINEYFETELWYTKTFRNDLFWVYNKKHLTYIKEYIGAKIRERNERNYMTLVETLPKFIKENKNREELLKLINILEKK